jgi:Holliday junction DNA helicase RuvA
LETRRMGDNGGMIASLRGVAEKNVEGVILDVAGVGYGVSVTSEDFGRLADGKEAKLYVHEHIREQGYDLFGFTLLDTKKLFEQLLNVKNVGPKVAMAVLDLGSASVVRGAIAAGDVKLLQSAKGVGKRAAEQIVVELRDKVGLAPGASAEDVVYRPGVNTQDEAVEALISLGYSPQDAATALQKIDSSLSTEERIKQALKG